MRDVNRILKHRDQKKKKGCSLNVSLSDADNLA